MVVLHLIDNLKVGGAQEILLNLTRFSGHDVVHHVVALYGPGLFASELQEEGVTVRWLTANRCHAIFSRRHYERLVKQLKPDVVNLHLEFSSILGLFWSRRQRGIRHVVTLHALKEQLPLWFYPLFSRLVPLADAVIVEDFSTRDQVGRIGVPPEKISYIPIGTDYLARIRERTAPPVGIRAEFNIYPGAPLILNVARMHPAKGQADLLRSFVKVLNALPVCRLLIVGYGREEQNLRRLATTLGLGESVIFAGMRRDLENFYADADLFAMTARDEGMGVVIYQAMAFGLPVVAYEAGSIAEVVVDAETGYLVPNGDTGILAERIVKILQDRPRYRDLYGRAAVERIDRYFSAAMMARSYEKTYRGVLSIP